MQYYPIQDYGIIGNCKTTALIHKEGSIDFFCYPRFDSPSIFAKILDYEKGGFFNTSPLFPWSKTTQKYLLDTNVLLTRFYSTKQTVDIIDFMPFLQDAEFPNQLVRVVKCVRGDTEFSFDLNVSPQYGNSDIECTKKSRNEANYCLKIEGGQLFEVKSNIELFENGNTFIDTFDLKEGEAGIFVLGDSGKASQEENSDVSMTVRSQLENTVKSWRSWMENCKYEGSFQNEVRRSALLLKLLTSSEFGSTVAAATFSLPESIGGSRNYDYRYTWIRDAAFTMYAFMRLGFFEESQNFMNWIQDRIEQDLSDGVDLQIMYKIDGSKDLEEKKIGLRGYKNSRPVRIGNAATEQIQLDIFGELMDTIYLFDKYGEPITYTFWKKLEKLLNFVCKNWNSADHGIWEVRETKRHYLYTRVMCWVALDRAVRLVRKRSFPTDLEKWITNKNNIFDDIQKNFWDESLQSFVHFKGAKTVDCSMLIMPLVRIISPFDKRWVKTMDLIENQLVSDILIYRNMNDEIPNGQEEGTFLIGAFWYIECLSRGGQIEKASHYFEKLLSYGNHLNLFAEEMSLSGMHLGNFPLAFTHLGLISAAYHLNHQKMVAKYTVNTAYDLF